MASVNAVYNWWQRAILTVVWRDIKRPMTVLSIVIVLLSQIIVNNLSVYNEIESIERRPVYIAVLGPANPQRAANLKAQRRQSILIINLNAISRHQAL